MEVFYSKPGVVEAGVLRDIDAIIVHWQQLYKGDIVKECCQAQLEQIQKGNAHVILVDSAEAKGVPPQNVQDWFNSTLFPAMSKAGLKAIITVIPKNALTKLASKQWSKTGEAFRFDMYDAESVAAAKSLARKLK